MRLDRRALLRASALGTCGLTAGCLGLRGATPSESPTPTETGTPLPTLPGPSPPADMGGPLVFDATVVEQSTSDDPATVRTALTNAGESTVRVGIGPTLVFRADGNAFAHGILLLPETDVGPNRTPAGPVDGCWRYTDDDFLVRDVREWHTLAPEEALAERQRVYTVGTDRPCLPAGEYPFVDDVVWGEESREVRLTLILTVREDGMMSVAPRAKRPKNRPGRPTG